MAEENKTQLTDILGGSTPLVDDDFTPKIPETSQFYCDAMNDDNINLVLNDVKPELIVLVGFSNYGKSTFIGTLYYYLMTHGRVDEYEMYDSDTISGFERRLYLRSMKNDPYVKSKTLRTEEEDDYMLTLNFYNPKNSEKKHLILSDRAGETYKKYVDNNDKVKAGDDWDTLQEKFRMLFLRLKENGKMPQDATFDLIFNKIDIVNANETLKGEYAKNKKEIVEFFQVQIGAEELLNVVELNSKKTHGNEEFENFVKELVKKDKTQKNEEAKLKSSLDWVGDKIK